MMEDGTEDRVTDRKVGVRGGGGVCPTARE